MKANERTLLTACIDTGIYAGWTRAHKHTDKPHELQIAEEIENAIWHEIDQYFDFNTDRNLFDEVMEGLDDREAKREALYDLVKLDMFKANSKLEGIDYDKKREWVGLTWDEACEIQDKKQSKFFLICDVEKKLREKNQ